VIQTTRRQFMGPRARLCRSPDNKPAGRLRPANQVLCPSQYRLARPVPFRNRHPLDSADGAPQRPSKPFQEAVAGFDLKGFIAAVEHAGADYVLFTAAHALQMLPAPHPVLDQILPAEPANVT